MNSLVSIIIPTKGSENTIEMCLRSIKNQIYKNIEIIVVDNYSNDNTVKIAKKYTKNIFEKGPERSAQRNYGVIKSKGMYLLIIDSDMELTENVVEECVNKQRDTNCSAAIIPEETIGNNFFGKIRSFERSFYIGEDLIEAARFFVKNDFIMAGMYDERITGQEDWELPIRMKKIGLCVNERINSMILHHEEDISLIGHLKKRYYYAKTAYIYVNKHPDYVDKQFNILYRYWIFLKKPKKFLANPFLGVIILIFKTLEFISAGLGYVSIKMKNFIG